MTDVRTQSAGSIELLPALEAKMLRIKEAERTTDPPANVHTEACSCLTINTHMGFKTGSMKLIMAASRARTCPITAEYVTDGIVSWIIPRATSQGRFWCKAS